MIIVVAPCGVPGNGPGAARSWRYQAGPPGALLPTANGGKAHA
jgi:hypothetical protein